MAKADENRLRQQQDEERTRLNATYDKGIDYTQGRLDTVTPRSDKEGADIWSGYSGLANDPLQGISQADRDKLMSGASSGDGGGGGGGGGSNPAQPDYLQTFYEMQGKTGGFDPTRLGNIEGTSASLRNSANQYGVSNEIINRLKDTSGNFGATNTSISGLQDFARTGGVSAENIAKIDNPTLEEFSRTGGYTPEQIANIRSRSNAGIASTYRNLKDQMALNNRVGGSLTPGYSSAGFKLARQGAQDIGTNAVNTELGIGDTVRAGRLTAASTLADKIQALAGLQSQNTLQGYGTSGQLDIDKQKAVNEASAAAMSGDLQRVNQIMSALSASGQLDLGTQQTINNARLAATSGLSQDALGRMSIGAASGAANAALNAANQRFLISEGNQNRATGLSGMLNKYGTAPAELIANQNQMIDWAGLQTQGNLGLLGSSAELAGSPGAFERTMGQIRAGAGAFGSVMTGGLANSFTNPGGSSSAAAYNRPTEYGYSY